MTNENLASVSNGAVTPRSKDGIFDAVSDRRRRYVLALLWKHEGPMSREDLATRVVARELDKPPRRVTAGERREALVSLHHVHLPKLADAGLIERDSDGRVAANRSLVGYSSLVDAIEDGDREEERLDRLFDVLSDPFRKTLLAVLAEQHPEAFPLSIEAVAEAVLADERSRSSGDRYERVLVSLHHRHLPKLADADLITYDRDEGTITYEGQRHGEPGGEPGSQQSRAAAAIDEFRSD